MWHFAPNGFAEFQTGLAQEVLFCSPLQNETFFDPIWTTQNGQEEGFSRHPWRLLGTFGTQKCVPTQNWAKMGRKWAKKGRKGDEPISIGSIPFPSRSMHGKSKGIWSPFLYILAHFSSSLAPFPSFSPHFSPFSSFSPSFVLAHTFVCQMCPILILFWTLFGGSIGGWWFAG